MAYRILIVDDEPMNHKMVGFILKDQGYDIISVESAKECIDILKVTIPDLILLDVEMPGMDGLTLLRTLRMQSDYKEIPVMFLTAHSSIDILQEAVSLGAKNFIKKPFVPGDLIDRIKSFFEENK